uniref:Secreted protein n=1 Tax=Denticeps clupeoides TaxID=299321 RepID=A0AAY4BJG6_9TELE
MKGSGKALTLHSSLAALPSTRTTSFSSCRIFGGPFSRSSFLFFLIAGRSRPLNTQVKPWNGLKDFTRGKI